MPYSIKHLIGSGVVSPNLLLQRSTTTFSPTPLTKSASSHHIVVTHVTVHAGLLTGDTGDFPPRLKELYSRIKEFIHSKVIPLEQEVTQYHDSPHTKWTVHPDIEQLKVCTMCTINLKIFYLDIFMHASICCP